ncbi:unnamed protein product [Phytophthora fragariaefolia]|uniref:Unnamed protein product n=1 Tax=Phytophthora fragariaefolia TaxID=1490495 RepID=A0A9W6UBB0_9STRA|nr:unnamed protein product [Phytophthora fragariaefolia]
MSLVQSRRGLDYEPKPGYFIGRNVGGDETDDVSSDGMGEEESAGESLSRSGERNQDSDKEEDDAKEAVKMTRLMAVASFKLGIKLQGTQNYEEWSLRIQMAMLTLNYNRIVLGDEQEADSSGRGRGERGQGRGGARARSSSTPSTRPKKKAKKGECFRCGSKEHFVRGGPQPAGGVDGDERGARGSDVASLNVMLTPRVSGNPHTEGGPAVGASGSTGGDVHLQEGEGLGPNARASGASGSSSAESHNGGELTLQHNAAAATAEVEGVLLSARSDCVRACDKGSGPSDAPEPSSELRTFTVRSGPVMLGIRVIRLSGYLTLGIRLTCALICCRLCTTGSTVKANAHMVLGVQKTAKVASSAAMGLLHNRLNHAGMEGMRRLAKHYDVGFKLNGVNFNLTTVFRVEW